MELRRVNPDGAPAPPQSPPKFRHIPRILRGGGGRIWNYAAELCPTRVLRAKSIYFSGTEWVNLKTSPFNSPVLEPAVFCGAFAIPPFFSCSLAVFALRA